MKLYDQDGNRVIIMKLTPEQEKTISTTKSPPWLARNGFVSLANLIDTLQEELDHD